MYIGNLHVSQIMPIFATSKSIQRHEDVTSRDERHFLCP